MPKRIGGIWNRICSDENILKSINQTIRNNPYYADNIWLSHHKEQCLEEVRDKLVNRTYQFHKLKHIKKKERKERIIDYARTYPDKVYINCVLNILKPLITKKYIYNTYSSIKGRGLHQALCHIEKAAKEYSKCYYVQTDIRKYYQNIGKEKCMDCIRRNIKDRYTVEFFDRLLSVHENGIPIGLSLSSYIANLFLTDVDRWAEKHSLCHIRYMDDMLDVVDTKVEAHSFVDGLDAILSGKGLSLKNNVRIAPVSTGIRMIGYEVYRSHVRLRKNIVTRFKRRHRKLVKEGVDDVIYKQQMASYFGWLIHGDCLHLLRKTMGDKFALFEKNIMEYKRLKDKKAQSNFFGIGKEARVSVLDLREKDIAILDFMKVTILNEEKLAVKFCYPEKEDEMHLFLTRSGTIADKLEQDRDFLPCVVTIREKTGKNGRKYITYE